MSVDFMISKNSHDEMFMDISECGNFVTVNYTKWANECDVQHTTVGLNISDVDNLIHHMNVCISLLKQNRQKLLDNLNSKNMLTNEE